jgi:protein-S-isoprenylcysteine O-methyltransferase Ste14
MNSLANRNPRAAGVKLPPPLIYAAAIGVGFGLQKIEPLGAWNAPPLRWAGWCLLALSFVLAMSAFREFIRARTTVHPNHQVSRIIKRGPFRFTRNPLYLALALVQGGVGLVLSNGWVLLMLIPAVATITIYVIFREEAYLERAFGEEYFEYKRRVRRWF